MGRPRQNKAITIGADQVFLIRQTVLFPQFPRGRSDLDIKVGGVFSEINVAPIGKQDQVLAAIYMGQDFFRGISQQDKSNN